MSTDQDALTHRIRQVVFDLRYLDEPMALRGRQQIEQAFDQVIVPLLEQAFDSYAPNNQVYRIDRLEIDLGRIDPDRLDAARIRQAIVAELGSRLGAPLQSPSELVAVGTLGETLAHFLELGDWPWHATFSRVADIEAAALALAPAEGRQLVLRLLPLLQRRSVRLRLAYQCSATFLHWLVEQLRPAQAADILQIARAVLHDQPAHEIWAIVLAVVVALPAAEVLSAIDLEQRLVLERGRLSVSENGFKPVGLAADAAAKSGQEIEQARNQGQASAASVYVLHAGIVLLHPFLEQFFQQLELTSDGVLLGSVDQRVRAVHLLYYLSTGQTQPEEHETPLLKFLCGLPIAFPLAKALLLSRQERDEAESLLAATIQHWAKLKNTSPAALRATFLQREGKLTHSDDTWRLVVEQRTVDLLLGYLPWTLSIIRLPWMAAPLWVDWA